VPSETPSLNVSLGPASGRAPATAATPHVSTDGKFLSAGGQAFSVRGATYGSFRQRRDGEPFPEPNRSLADFVAMAEAGLNTIRTYTLPPDDVLELAGEAGLRLLVGLHYHDWRMEPRPCRRAQYRVREAGKRALDAALQRCAGRSEVLAVAVGNEVPADLVRLHGTGAVEELLSELCEQVRTAGLLATYVNYPTTEYLAVEGQDLVCFNVFLEDPGAFRVYLGHLHTVAGSRPLLITELGLAAGLHGEEAQADALAWQLQAVVEAGCAGATVFSWTDEWSVNEEPVDGWGFGITDAERRPKAALDVVRTWARTRIADARSNWPRVSVVVCARNEEAMIGRCLDSLERSDYPDLEVIVCDDGSTDRTLELARQFPFRILPLEHGGLGQARNEGLRQATGEIVAYLDADAECHPEWPYHLALSLENEAVGATGGPNLPPEAAPFTERAIALAPGGPTEVLVSDDRAEHVPGCNMAFRAGDLRAIGGFDRIYRAAGDDVDVCWRLLDHGREIAFSPAAQVRHHRPAGIRDYLRQQRSYGRSERLLSGRHRHRFNMLGQPRWTGSIYGGPCVLPALLRPIVYHGPMGLAPFQTVRERPAERALRWSSALLPFAVPLVLLGALAAFWSWFLAAPAVAVLGLATYSIAIDAAVEPPPGEPRPLALKALVAALHVSQPFARAYGRLSGRRAPALRTEQARNGWCGDRALWLEELQRELAARRCRVRSGGPHDRHDLTVSLGPFVACRLRTAVAWQWVPLQCAKLRLRLTGFLGAAAAAAIATVDAPAGLSLLGALAAEAGFEALILRRRVGGSIRATTQGVATTPAAGADG
jgi:GT2 family glycosyltransferase